MELQRRRGVKAALQPSLTDKHFGDQALEGVGTPFSACLIVIQGEQNPALGTRGLDNQALLLLTHGASHQGNHILSAALPQIKEGEEPFDHNQAFAGVLPSTVEIEEHQGLPEVGREFVLPLPCWWFSNTPACIGDELAVLIMYRDDYPVMHDAFAGVVAEPECINGCFPEAAFLGEIRVSVVKVLKRELQRWICALPCFLVRRFDVQICSHCISGRCSFWWC